MPRSKEQNEQIRREKSARILEVAIQMFATKGYAETTIANVAKEAGVSFGSVFSYFSSKEELFRAAVLEPLQEMRLLIPHEQLEAPFSMSLLRETVTEHVHFFVRQDVYLRLIQYILVQPDRFPELFAELDQFAHAFRGAVCTLIERGQESGLLEDCTPIWVSISYLSFLIGIRVTQTDPQEHTKLWNAMIEQAILLFRPRGATPDDIPRPAP